MEVNRDGNCDEFNKTSTSEAGISNSETSSVLKSNLFLDKVGEVALTLRPDGLSWEFLNDSVKGVSTCLGIKFRPDAVTEIKFCDMYSVEFINYGLIRGSNQINVGKHLLDCHSHNPEMFRFAVHGIQKSQSHPCVLVPATYTFGHVDLQTCKIWIERIDASLKLEGGRPKNLLVFVNPRSGKSNGFGTWDGVSHIFSHAKIETKVIVTQRAGHAFDVMASMGNNELNSYDGFVTVGGDGFFNEMLNGFLLSRHRAPYPPSPSDLEEGNSEVSVPVLNGIVAETNCPNEDQSPLLLNSSHNRSKPAHFRLEDSPWNAADHDLEFPLERFRFGIIPAGSTDAIVMCTTGTRDPVTSALNIVMGKRLHLDIAQVVRWKATSTSKIEPFVRYAASFAGYGFYGDVITESEKYRWMGPKRYDYAGTKVFLKHRSYEAEVAYVESESEKTNAKVENGFFISRVKGACVSDKPERAICRVNCGVCNMKPLHASKKTPRSTPYTRPEGSKWAKCKGHFLSVGAAIMSNRNERAPDGLVADAHLSDGFLHLLLIRDCPRAHYLWHLTQLAKRGGKPLNFEFVEHHKTTAFTFTSFGDESVWNLDGELFPAHQLSAQVFRGLITLFASGPEV